MIIKFSPSVGIDPEDRLAISKRGDVLTVNGERFDFRPLPEGAVLPASAVDCDYIEQEIRRVDGDLIITFRLPIAPDASAAACFPRDIINPPDGYVSIPQ